MLPKATLLFGRIIGIIVLVLSHSLPRDRRLWAFGSWHGTRFADNTKWLFLHCLATRASGGDAPRVVWISRRKAIVSQMREAGLPSYYAWSLAGLFYAFRAGVYVFDAQVDDVVWWASGGVRRVNLWHGSGLKRIERDIQQTSHPRWKLYHGSLVQRLIAWVKSPWVSIRPHMVLASSAETSRTRASAFGLPVSQVPALGYPRNDLFQPSGAGAERTELEEELAERRASGMAVICYMPTFRDGATAGAQLPLEWGRLQAFLEGNNALFLLKLHGNDRAGLPDLNSYPNIVVVPSAVDAQPLLRQVDVLVTDYSSVYVDYLLLDRPIVFYCYDLEQYLARDRGLYYEYGQVTPGAKVRTSGQLEEAVARSISAVRGDEKDEWVSERERVRAMFFAHTSGLASERVMREIQRRFS